MNNRSDLVDLLVEGGANIYQVEGDNSPSGRSRHTHAEVLAAIAVVPATLKRGLEVQLAGLGKQTHYDVG